MSQRRLTHREIEFLQEALSSDCKIGNLRLREGEYQYNLAQAIASFLLESYFPDVKDIIRKLYGEEKTSDVQFVRKIQTILKKMEKSNIVKIIPKKTPWELQRYALTSFKFQDSDKNLVTFATDQQIKNAQDVLQSISYKVETAQKTENNKARIAALTLCIIASYVVIVWNFAQPIISLIIFVPAFSVAVCCSIMLGKILSRGWVQ